MKAVGLSLKQLDQRSIITTKVVQIVNNKAYIGYNVIRDNKKVTV